MAEPLSVTVVGGSVALAALSAAANASDLVQGLDSYLSIVDPAAGCSVDAEPFVLKAPPPPASEAPADKHRALRPEGAQGSARTGAPATPAASSTTRQTPSPAVPTLKFVADLVSVENEISLLDSLLLEFNQPQAFLSLAVFQHGDSVTCVPHLRLLSGFDSRIGNQVSFKCRAVAHSDSAAIVVTEVLYNPFFKESGFITAFHSIQLNDRLNLEFLRFDAAPSNAFHCAPINTRLRIRPR
jgi:hypothetical protein